MDPAGWRRGRRRPGRPGGGRASRGNHLSRAHIAPGKMGAGPRAQHSLRQRCGRGSRRPFHGRCCRQVLALGRDGSLRLAFGMKRGTRTHTRVERVEKSPQPTSRCRSRAPERRHQPRRANRRARPARRRPASRALNHPGGDGGRPGLTARWRSVHQATPWESTSARSAPGAPAAGVGRRRRSTQCRHARPCLCRPSSGKPRVLRRNRPGPASGGGKVPRPTQATTSSQAASSSRAAIPPGRRDSSASTAAEWKTRRLAVVPATSTAMAWMTSSASGRCPSPRAALKS